MTDPTPPHRRSPMEHERDACPYCAEDVLTIAYCQGALSERKRNAARIKALEAENGRLRGALEDIADALGETDIRAIGKFAPAVARAALKGEGE